MGLVQPTYLFIEPGDVPEGEDHPNVALIQKWITDRGNHPFDRLDTNRQAYGGSKTMCENTYVGVFSGFLVNYLVDYVRSLEWDQENDGVQMLTKGDDDVFFTLTTISGIE